MVRKKIILTISICITISVLNLQAKILTLSYAENTAISTGFEAREKHFEEQAKEWEKRNTIAKYLPTVDYSMNYMRLGDKTIEESNKVFEGFESIIPDDLGIDLMEGDYANPMKQFKNSLKHEFSINQPITNGGVEIIAIKIAKHTMKAMKLQVESLKQETIYNMRKAYFDAIAAMERTKVAKQDLAWAKQNLHKANIKFKTGGIPVTDVLQWEAEVSKKESDVLEAVATEKFMLYTLYQILGSIPDKIDSYNLQPFESFELWYGKGMIATKESIKGNFDLRALKEFTVVSEKNKKIAISTLLPKVNAFLSYTLEHVFNDTTHFVKNIKVKPKPPNFAVGAVMSVPLFSGFKNPTNYKKADYEYKKVKIKEQKVESQLKVNLERIKLFYKASYEAVKAAKKQQELMERQLDIMQKRYDGGLVNQSQLLEVSLGTSQTRIGYIQKVFKCLLYEAEYLKNVGKLEVAQ